MSNADRTLWVGNLHDKVTEELLYELFLQAGPLERVAIPKDKDGRPKRFAFVTFEHSCSVPYTIQLMNETPLFGQSLRIQCRSGSVHDQQHQQQQHQQAQQQQQFQMNQNPYQSNAPMVMVNQYQGGPPAMKPYRSNQSMRGSHQNGRQFNQAANPYQGNIPQKGSPQLQKSNTWHGNDLSDLDEGEKERDSRGRGENDRDRYNSRDRDRDRSGDRYRHGDRNRQHDQYGANRNSPLPGDSNGRNSPLESQRDRLLRKQQVSLDAYRGQGSRSNSGQSKPWQSRQYNQRRGRY